MAKKNSEKRPPREDEFQAAVRVVNTIIRKHEGEDSSLTDDPNVLKMPKKKK